MKKRTNTKSKTLATRELRAVCGGALVNNENITEYSRSTGFKVEISGLDCL